MKWKFIHILFLVSSLFLISFSSNAQEIVTGNAFLKGKYIEVGISPNQSFGSGVNAPAGYHPRGSGLQLGFVSDPALDGWTIGTPNYIGCYFLPGVPQEGWDMSINGTWFRAYRDDGSASFFPAAGFTGAITSVYTSGTRIGSVWEGSINTLSIRANTSFDTLQSFFRVDVTITNTGATTLTNLYYSRTLDPDNESVVPGGGGPTTVNTIEFQPNLATGDYRALVSAVGLNFPSLSYLGLGTVDCRAKAYILNSGLVPGVGPHQIEAGSGFPFHTTLRHTITNDIAVGLIFDLGDLAPGDSTTFAYTYILSADDLDTAMTSLATGFNINGIDYTAVNDTVIYEHCSAGDSIEVSIAGGGSFNWGAWSPTTGLSSLTGPNNTIVTPTSPITYRVIGTNPICTYNDTLYLTIIPSIPVTVVNDTICEGETYTFNGNTLTAAGSYYDTLPAVGSACDSIIQLNLSINPIIINNLIDTICSGSSLFGYTSSGTYHDTFMSTYGCDSIRILSLHVQSSIIASLSDTICEGESLYGYTTSGTYHDTFTSAAGCDSIRLLSLTVLPIVNTSINIEICSGDNYMGYTIPDTYIDTFASTNGCDSIRTLNLTINTTSSFTIDHTICEGETYLGYSNTGTYYDTFTSVHGCDSVRILNLNVEEISYTTVALAICQNDLPYTFSGITIPSTAVSATNYDTITHTSIHGCDSNIIVNLIIWDTTTSLLTHTVCEGQDYLGYTTTGTYRDSFLNSNGCDSIRTINLTVLPRLYETVTMEICQGSSYHGYTTTGTYVDTFLSITGCDSIRTLELIVNPVLFTTFNDTICEGENYLGYTTTGTHVDSFTSIKGCDSIRTIHLVVNPISTTNHTLTLCRNELPYTYHDIIIPPTATSTVNYDTLLFLNSLGCDSFVYLNLVIHDTSAIFIDTNVCFDETFTWNGISITTAGEYTFVGTNMNGCDSVVRLTVDYSDRPQTIVENYSGCGSYTLDGITYERDTTLFDTVYTIVGCDSLYFIQDINILEIAYDTIEVEICRGETYNFNGSTYNNSTVVTQQFVNDNGCDSFITLNLTVHALPDVRLEVQDNFEICVGDTILLKSYGAEYYLFYDQFDRKLIHDPASDTVSIRVPSNEFQYYVIGTDEHGCSLKTYVTVYANDCCELVIPNAFSPNGDGLNDKFGVVTLGHPEDFVLRIYNRWGEAVFISYKPNDKWDGTYNGKPCDIGTYYYHLSTKCYNGATSVQKGELTLLR